MQRRMLSQVLASTLASTLVITAGCRSSSTTPTVGDRLPVASSRSVALPGAVDAADAPKAPAVAEPRTDDLVQYRDPTHGVRFQYPSVWRPAQPGNSDLGQPYFAQAAPRPLITQVFSTKGTPYADTVLDSLSFSYTVQARTTAAACAAIPGKALQAPLGRSPVTYNGRRYSESSGGDAGMCHHFAATVDTTFQGSTCYIFERDTMALCPSIKTQTEPRPLTAPEQQALQRHLDAVMGSVQIAGSGN